MQWCPYRKISEEGQLWCGKILSGDQHVDAEICSLCPVATINCANLKFSLERRAARSILVHYANGRQDYLRLNEDSLDLQQGACAELLVPISGPSACAGCAVRQLLTPAAQEPSRRSGQIRVLPRAANA